MSSLMQGIKMMSDNNLGHIFLNLVTKAIKKNMEGGNWKVDSKFNEVRNSLQADSRGQVGEEFVAEVLKTLGYSVDHTQATDPQNKQWDLVVDDKYQWEVKTATMGRKSKNFQHEHIYKERQYHGIIFLDIAPDDLYISFFPKHKIDWSSLHRRKDSNFYKWDLQKSKIEKNLMVNISDFKRGYEEAIAEINLHLEKIGNPHRI